jgi:hypothetical protein
MHLGQVIHFHGKRRDSSGVLISQKVVEGWSVILVDCVEFCN